MKNYLGLLSRLHDTPLLMDAGKLKIITEAVTIPLLQGNASIIDNISPQQNATKKEFNSDITSPERKITVITVFDSLVSKNAVAGSGLTSYEAITDQINLAISNNVTDIGFYIDSPGGEPSVFGLTDKIRSLKSLGINTFSFCDQATSAAYAIAAATDVIYTTQIGAVGGIAAILVHAEISKLLDKEGTTYTIIRSKEEKALGDSYTKLSEAALQKFNSMLEILDREFNNDILKSRKILNLETIQNLKGNTQIGTNAIKFNLADKIVPSFELAISDFLTNIKVIGEIMTEEEINNLKTNLSDSQQKVTELEEKLLTMNSAEQIKANQTEELIRVNNILGMADKLNIDLKTATKYIDTKYSEELAKDIFTDLAAAKDAKNSLNSSTNIHTDEDENQDNTNINLLSKSYTKMSGTQQKGTN